MKNILRDDYADILAEPVMELIRQQNTLVLETIAKRVENIGKLTKTDIHKLKSSIDYAGIDLDNLKKELAKMDKQTISKMKKMFATAARDNIEFANTYYAALGLKTLPLAESAVLKSVAKAATLKRVSEYINLSRTRAFFIDGKLMSVRQEYLKLVDSAIFNVATGTIDYNTAMKQALRKMANSGVRVTPKGEKKADFPSGYNRRLDSQMRMNLLDGVRQLNIDIQQEIGNQYGADGVEVSAHANCAKDHQDIQGIQCSTKGAVTIDGVYYEDFESVNGSLQRPIGTMNCGHFVFPIILGLSERSVSKSDVAELNRKSNELVKYGNRELTRYEATQAQRQQETRLRKLKDERNTFKAAGNEYESKRINKKIYALGKQYRANSEGAGLRPRMERARVIK